MDDAAIVFVHGLFSSSRTWRNIRELLGSDPDLSALSLLDFEYPSPRFRLHPLRRIPDYTVVADCLTTYLETMAAEYPNVVIVTHSQGGLIVQRFLARMVMSSRGRDLRRIRRIVMFACPNSGSEAFIAVRRWARFWSNPQERTLRPINESVVEAQRIVIDRIVYAKHISSEQCPIPILAYAGDRDNIVTPASAKGVFPKVGILPGDHFSIIQPDSREHRTYAALRAELLSAFRNSRTSVDHDIDDEVAHLDMLADEIRPLLLGRLQHPRLGTLDFFDRQTMVEIIREVGKLDE